MTGFGQLMGCAYDATVANRQFSQGATALGVDCAAGRAASDPGGWCGYGSWPDVLAGRCRLVHSLAAVYSGRAQARCLGLVLVCALAGRWCVAIRLVAAGDLGGGAGVFARWTGDVAWPHTDTYLLFAGFCLPAACPAGLAGAPGGAGCGCSRPVAG